MTGIGADTSAGIAFGCVVGVLFAAALAYLIFRRRVYRARSVEEEWQPQSSAQLSQNRELTNKSNCSTNLDCLQHSGTALRNETASPNATKPSFNDTKQLPEDTTPIGKAVTTSFNGTAPPPEDTISPISTRYSIASEVSDAQNASGNDEAVKAAFQYLNHTIKQHVQTSYHTNRVQEPYPAWKISQLDEVLSVSPAPTPAQALHALLQAPQTRRDTIRMFIAWIIVYEYLPPEVREHGDREKSEQITALITSILESHIIVPPTPSPDPDLSQPTPTPIPYSLTGILDAAFTFRAKLSSSTPKDSPSPVWEFAWTTLMSDELVVFPALVRAGGWDEKRKNVRQSVVVQWEETRRIDDDGGRRWSRLSRSPRFSRE